MQEEEEQERRSSMEGNPKLGLSPPPLEGDSDVPMVDESLLQCNSDVIIEGREGRKAWRQMHC